MTKLERLLKRETPALVRSQGKLREVVIELRPPFVIRLRLKGTRQSYEITAAGLFQVLGKLNAERIHEERMAARKAKRERSRA
ncbi:MAG: hypothetical protein AAB964_01330 [Patescibacteria group bacterium]